MPHRHSALVALCWLETTRTWRHYRAAKNLDLHQSHCVLHAFQICVTVWGANGNTLRCTNSAQVVQCGSHCITYTSTKLLQGDEQRMLIGFMFHMVWFIFTKSNLNRIAYCEQKFAQTLVYLPVSSTVQRNYASGLCMICKVKQGCESPWSILIFSLNPSF